jgi:hypothetical protein
MPVASCSNSHGSERDVEKKKRSDKVEGKASQWRGVLWTNGEMKKGKK